MIYLKKSSLKNRSQKYYPGINIKVKIKPLDSFSPSKAVVTLWSFSYLSSSGSIMYKKKIIFTFFFHYFYNMLTFSIAR